MNKALGLTIGTLAMMLISLILLSYCEFVFAAGEDLSVGDVEVRVWPEATVDTDKIKLGQIATIVGLGDDVAALKGLEISLVVASRKDSVVRAWQIASRISEAGFDPVNIRITGAARCKVHIVKKVDDNRSSDNGYGTKVDMQSSVAPKSSLKAKIRDLIYNHLSSYTLRGEHRLKIKFNPVVSDLLALSEPAYQFDIQPQKRRPKWIGLVPLKVKVFQKGELIQTVPILVQVDLSAKVLIAKRKINSKALVGRHDVEWVWRDVRQLRGKEPVYMEELSSVRSKHLITAGTILTKDLFEPIPLVKRGQLVTVIYQNGGLEIKTVGKAMRTGCKDEIIPVRNERSKNVFRARVLSSGKVLVSSSVGVDSSGYSLTVGSKR